MVTFVGVIAIETSVAVVIVSPVDPEIPLAVSVAVMVAAPEFLPLAIPRLRGALLMLARFGFDEDHETYCVMSRVSPPV
jgi:hypothetical protein